MTKQVLVWGATGFIGRQIVASLVADGIQTTILTRSERDDPKLKNLCLDSGLVTVATVTEGSSMTESLARYIANAGLVFNLAGVSGAVPSNRNPLESLDGNCGIQARFFRACELAGNCPHIVFASSRLVYGMPLALPVPETAALLPQSYYAAHKICVEQYHRIAALRKLVTYTICRISNPYGPLINEVAGGYGFVSNLIARGMRGEPLRIFGDGTQIRDYLHISDLVRGLRLCGEHKGACNQILNLGFGEGIPIRDVANIIAEKTNSAVLYSDWPEEYSIVESGDFVADISLARALIGYSPRFKFREGLSEVISVSAVTATDRKKLAVRRNGPAVQVT